MLRPPSLGTQTAVVYRKSWMRAHESQRRGQGLLLLYLIIILLPKYDLYFTSVPFKILSSPRDRVSPLYFHSSHHFLSFRRCSPFNGISADLGGACPLPPQHLAKIPRSGRATKKPSPLFLPFFVFLFFRFGSIRQSFDPCTGGLFRFLPGPPEQQGAKTCFLSPFLRPAGSRKDARKADPLHRKQRGSLID